MLRKVFQRSGLVDESAHFACRGPTFRGQHLLYSGLLSVAVIKATAKATQRGKGLLCFMTLRSHTITERVRAGSQSWKLDPRPWGNATYWLASRLTFSDGSYTAQATRLRLILSTVTGVGPSASISNRGKIPQRHNHRTAGWRQFVRRESLSWGCSRFVPGGQKLTGTHTGQLPTVCNSREIWGLRDLGSTVLVWTPPTQMHIIKSKILFLLLLSK